MTGPTNSSGRPQRLAIVRVARAALVRGSRKLASVMSVWV